MPLAGWLLSLGAMAAYAEQELVTEVIAARHRDPAELARALAPLVPPPGSVSSFADKLIIKSTSANLVEIRRLLAALDTRPANLLISVRRTLDAEVRRDLAEVYARARTEGLSAQVGRPNSGAGASVAIGEKDYAAGARVQRSTRTRQDNETQSLRVLEGEEAFIHSGESVPLGERNVVITGAGVSVVEGVRYEEFGSGFFVRPRLSGDTVTLIARPVTRLRRGDGSAPTQEASTTVSGPLGRWMMLGGADAAAATSSAGLSSSRTTTTRREATIYIKVERID